MTRETYIKMTGKLRKKTKTVRLVNEINHILTGIVFFSYPFFLLRLLFGRDPFLVRAIAVPAVSFVLVTIFRRALNLPRPYERFGVPPVLDKDTSGKSFPSRHVFSVFVIAVTVYVKHPEAGILLGILGVVLAAIRVVGGVHSIWDVTAGMAFGILAGAIGYYLL